MSVISSLNILLGLDAAGVAAGAKKSRAGMREIEGHAHSTGRAVAALSHMLKTVGIGLSAYEIVGFFKSSYEAFHEADQQQRKLAGVLEATGHAAGYTRDQLEVLNSSLQRQTNFDDDAIAGGEAVLATFKEIKGANFRRATESMLGLSAVLGQDLQSSAIQLGKALNDPIRGITALRRVGVSFTDEQQEMIDSFVKLGDIVSAQNVILNELNSEGFNLATAQGMRSEITGLANDFGDLKETIGSFAESAAAKDTIDLISSALRGLNEQLKEFEENGVTYTGYWETFKNASKGYVSFLLGQRKVERLDAETLYRAEHDQGFARDHAAEIAEARARAEDRNRGVGANLTHGPSAAAAGRQAFALTAAAEDQAEANKAARDSAKKLADDVTALTHKLRLQALTFGMSSDEAYLFSLRLQGANQEQIKIADAALKHISALQAQREAQRQAARAQEEQTAKIRSMWEQARTPVEKYLQKIKELNHLARSGALENETVERLKGQARAELKPDEAAELDRKEENHQAYVTAKGRLEYLRKRKAITQAGYKEHSARLEKADAAGHGAAQEAKAIELRRRYEKELNRLESQRAAGKISRGQFAARVKNAGKAYEAHKAKLADEFPAAGETHRSSANQDTLRESRNSALVAGSAEAFHAVARFQNPSQTFEKQSLQLLREILRALHEQRKEQRRQERPNVIRRV